jgi:hypothetical protein
MLTRSPAEQAQDDVLKRILKKDEFLRWENRVRTANIWDLGHSYVYSRIVDNDQFHNTRYRHWVERSSVVVPFDDFAQDQTFVQAVKAVNASGVPYVIVNLPMGGEIEAGAVPVLGRSLARSIERLTGHEIVGLLPHMSVASKDAGSICVSAVDCHPNVFGMTEYAAAAAKVIRARFPELRLD